MIPLLAMFTINVGWLVILLGGLVVYLSMRRRQPAQPAATCEPLVAEIPCVLPADAPRPRHNPLRNPRFSRPPMIGVVALTAGACCVLLCMLLLATVFVGSSKEAVFVSHGSFVVAEERAFGKPPEQPARPARDEAILLVQQPIAGQAPEPLPAPRGEVVAQPAPKQVAAAVPLPPQLQPQAQPKPKASNPTRTSAARSQEIVVEGEYQKSHEAAWRSFLEQAQVDIKEHLRERGIILDAPPTRELIENKMIVSKDREPEVRDFGGNVGVVRRFVLTVEITPEVRTLLAKQDREFRAQQRMLLLGKILAGVVVLLAAAALYFRLDEYTKGYYTSSLRWAALGVVTGFIVFLLFGS